MASANYWDIARPAMVEANLHRPKVQRWMALRGLERKMAEYDPPHADAP